MLGIMWFMYFSSSDVISPARMIMKVLISEAACTSAVLILGPRSASGISNMMGIGTSTVLNIPDNNRPFSSKVRWLSFLPSSTEVLIYSRP